MNMHCCSLKTNCSIKFSIPKWYENTPFHNLNITHAGAKYHQVTWTFLEIKETHWSTLKIWKLMNMNWCSLKTNCTIKLSIPKLYENTSFGNFNITHVGAKNHQVTITFMHNQGNTLINTEKMKVDEHAVMLIKNRMHH